MRNNEIDELRARLLEAEQTLQAIRTGDVDALVVSGPSGDQIFSLRGADTGYRAMVEQMQEGAVTVDGSGLILYANRRFGEMLGQPPDDVMGRQLEIFLGEQDRSSLQRLLEGGGAAARQETHLRTASGSLIPVQIAMSRLPDSEALSMYVLVITDLTILHQKDQILESARLTRSILDNTTEAIVVCDKDARVVEANAAAHTLCSGQPAGRHFLEVFPLRMQDPEVVLTKSLAGSVVRGAVAWMACGEEQRCLLVSAGPLAAERTGMGCVISLVDDTPRARAQGELKALNECLEQRVVERTVVAHQQARQLRVLATELAYTEQRERARLAQVLHDHLQQLLVASSLKAGRLRRQKMTRPIADQVSQIEDLLRQAIQASRELTLELSPPILYEAGLGSALRWLARQMQERHALVVEVDAPDETPGSIEGLGLFLFTAARELLFNVVKHGGISAARISLQTGQDNEVRLTVEDHGVGFDTSVLDKRRGQSFGLFSIRDRLELLGGRLEAESSPGGGTRVTLVAPMTVSSPEGAEPFPLKLMPEPPGGDTAAMPEAMPFEANGRRLRILLADDHTILRQGLASLLANEPDMETIAEASTGVEAVELTRMLRPDVIVMDASMPEMSGLEATRHIMERYPQTLVVGLSMYDSEDMSDAMRAAGARAYVTKEKASEELCSVIRTIVQSSRRPHPSPRSTAAPSGRATGRRASGSKP